MDKSALILGILIGAICMFLLIHLLWHLGYYILYFIVSVLRRSDKARENQPKSLSNLEKMVLPQVLNDFTDFDLSPIKAQVQEEITSRYGTRPGVQILNIVLNDYRKQGLQKFLVFEASVCWKEKKLIHRKLRIFLKASENSQPLLCPGCSAEAKPGDLYCRSCGMVLPENSSWEFQKIQEV